MTTLKELMGDELYRLIYLHYDNEGNKIDDPDDVLYCEDEDIDLSRISPLKKLLVTPSLFDEAIIRLEAAKLLAAWGVEEAVDFFDGCIDARIDKLGNLCPDRLHGYDVVYEQIADSILNYYARLADRGLSDQATYKIQPIILKLLKLAEILPFKMLMVIDYIKEENWRYFERQLKNSFICFLERTDQSFNDYWNIRYLKKLFEYWDVDFLNDLEKKYGIIDLPEGRSDDFLGL